MATLNRGAVMLLRVDLTLREIASRLARRGENVSLQAVCLWRCGAIRPARDRRRALALEFGIPPAAWDWAGDVEPPPPPPWRAAWRDARTELRHAIRLRLAISSVT